MALGYKLVGFGIGTSTNQASQDPASGIVAAGTTQGTATELVNAVCFVDTVASNTGVILASKGAPGDSQYILNSGANPLKVYPQVGAQMNGLPVNTPFILAVNTSCSCHMGGVANSQTVTRIMVNLSS